MLPFGDIAERGCFAPHFARRLSPRVIHVDAYANNESILGWRWTAGRLDEYAAYFDAIEKHVVGPLKTESRMPGLNFVGERIADRNPHRQRKPRPVAWLDVEVCRFQQQAESQRPVGRPPGILATSAAGRLAAC